MSGPSVLIVAAHPDDEVLGCGGTIARHRKMGARVTVLTLADGVSSRPLDAAATAAAIDERRGAARRAAEILGVDDLTMLSYADNRMDTVPRLEIIRDIEGAIARCRPAIVYTHQAGDVNVDHVCVHHAVVAACRPQPGCTVRRLLFFEVPSSTEWCPPPSARPFAPNWFTDISDTLELKLEAMGAYARELREFPHPRSLAGVEHLARWRGATAGLHAAEAFELGRFILSSATDSVHD